MKNSTNNMPNKYRARLLATASAVALIASVCGTELGHASEANDESALWVDIGWNAENVRDLSSGLALPLGSLAPQFGLTAPLMENLDLARSYGQDGKITYRPDYSDWVFSASVRYGRAQGKSQINQALAPIPATSLATYHLSIPIISYHVTRAKQLTATTEKLKENSNNAQSHFIVDFQAGKDVGLGLLGQGSTSTLSAGLRFAHFTMSRKVSSFHETSGIHFQTSRSPGTFYGYPLYKTRSRELWNVTSASGSASQNFNGVGPSIQWNASAQLWDNPQGGGLSLDWGANAALLFGKQKKKIQHQTMSSEHCLGSRCPARLAVYTSGGQVRTSKSITVPNVGGFAGFSLNFPGVKVSLGYRADLFVNAIDVGFAMRKSSNMLLHGPFADVSIDLGD